MIAPSPSLSMLARTVVLTVGALVIQATTIGVAQETGTRNDASRYQLVEEWSVAAQGPVHLREKRVKATYQLEAKVLDAMADGKWPLEIRFVQVSAEAEISAQKRKGQFDSTKQSAEQSVEHHELINAIALSGQTLRLTFSPDGTLSEVTGLDPVLRRLDELYDKSLRGSEQDLNTRDIERQRLMSEELCRTWADLFVVGSADRQATEPTRQRAAKATVMACIPSESWMKSVTVPVTETVRLKSEPDGRTKIETSAVLAESQLVRTMIGSAPWSYEPKEIKRETTALVCPDGLVEKRNSSLAAVLSTTLTLGQDVPVQMTIRHSTELIRREPKAD